jgi:hypothetical protein
MVSPDFCGVVPSLMVVAEIFQGTDDGEELLIMGFVISFSRLE